jgi:hypothetical protein
MVPMPISGVPGERRAGEGQPVALRVGEQGRQHLAEGRGDLVARDAPAHDERVRGRQFLNDDVYGQGDVPLSGGHAVQAHTGGHGVHRRRVEGDGPVVVDVQAAGAIGPRADAEVPGERPGEDLVAGEPVIVGDPRGEPVGGEQVRGRPGETDPGRVALRGLAHHRDEPAMQVVRGPVRERREGRQRHLAPAALVHRRQQPQHLPDHRHVRNPSAGAGHRFDLSCPSRHPALPSTMDIAESLPKILFEEG